MNQRLSKAQVKWVRGLQQKKQRDEQGLFIAEGEKCIGELKDAFEMVLHISPANASTMEIEQMSSMRTPQGTMAVFKQRPMDNDAPLPELWLALDGVQDPGNLGTIIRTCDWFGVHHIICSRDTADCYNPKVVQATMGALARVKIQYVDDLASVLKQSCEQGYPIYGTQLDGRNIYYADSVPTKQKGVIVMGNEGKGLSPEVRAVVSHPLLIPSYAENCVESLNVSIATAIILSEFRRNNA
jgi:TrmH family RNA methyltransferase